MKINGLTLTVVAVLFLFLFNIGEMTIVSRTGQLDILSQ